MAKATAIHDETELTPPRRLPYGWRVAGGVVVGLIALVASFELVYANKVYPGISADGAYVGGLSHSEAATKVGEKTTEFHGQSMTLTAGNTTLQVPVSSLRVTYDTGRVVDLAYTYGRRGNLGQRVNEQLRALLGRLTTFAAYSYSDEALATFIVQAADDTVTPVADATLTFNDNTAQVTPATNGTRLDLGRLTQTLVDHIATTDASDVSAPTYPLGAVVGTEALKQASSQANTYVAAPIPLAAGSASTIIDQGTIISWLKVSHRSTTNFMTSLKLDDLYQGEIPVTLSLNPAAVNEYVAKLAAKTNQDPQNAQLSMVGGVLTVVAAAQSGIKMDAAAAITDITSAVTKAPADRTVTLKLTTAQAAVREDNLADLGITGLISEGETYFPGSPSTRLINVRAGARKFNNVLLAPGEQFSFGKLLGQVDASTGYVPELVILGDHEEKQYGGGLCQVSSTAFRAALAAGLPINERVNHAFAISYYTWPYSAPGVDATIYYPDVDFKFTNDTGHYLLMQTIMNGVDLKFDFYGTKTKSGVIRGPNFITGSSDAKQPSHTVFYRDVLDLAGNVTKTDTFNTFYKPSTDFPITKQFN